LETVVMMSWRPRGRTKRQCRCYELHICSQSNVQCYAYKTYPQQGKIMQQQ